MSAAIRWADWSGALTVTIEEREKWAAELAKGEAFYSISGDSMMIATLDDEDGTRQIELFDCVLRRRGSAPLPEGCPLDKHDTMCRAASEALDLVEDRFLDNVRNGGLETDSQWMSKAAATLRKAGRLTK